MKKRDGLRTQICKWLERNNREFTSAQLANWLGKPPKRVSTELCFLRTLETPVVKITGRIDKLHKYKRCVDGEIVIEEKPKKIAHTPGVLGITTHRMDHGVERVIF